MIYEVVVGEPTLKNFKHVNLHVQLTLLLSQQSIGDMTHQTR